MLILIMAANTGFADFPRLASFQASDRFLPKQMTKRGHRLVYSNGVVVLAGVAMLLVVVTGGVVTKLIPLYAIGVFTGFTLSQAGMVKHHLTHRHPGWRQEHRDPGDRLLPVVRGAADRVDHEVPRGRVGDPHRPPGAGRAAAPPPPAVRERGRSSSSTRSPPPPPRRSCAGTSCWCSSTGSTPPPPAPSSTPAASRPTSCGRCTSSSTTPTPRSSPSSGASSGSSGSRSSWWPAPTAASRARRWSASPGSCPIARPRCPCSSPSGSTRGSGTASSTTAPVTRSRSRCPTSPTPTSPSVPFHFGSRAEVPGRPPIGRPRPRSRCRGPSRSGRTATARRSGGLVLPGTVPIADARWRRRVTVGGRVRSVRVAPLHDSPTPRGGARRRHRARSRSCSSVAGRSPASRSGTAMTAEGMVGVHQARLAIINPDLPPHQLTI